MTIIFAAYHNFHSNSSIQIFSLANRMIELGHAVFVCVPEGKATAALPGDPLFSTCTYEEALAFPGRFAGPPGATVIHAWTPREIVRKFAQQLRSALACPLVVHLEDNEQIVTSATLRREWEELTAMSEEALDALIPDSLSHPHRYPAFLRSASGVTYLVDRLSDFIPAGKPKLMFWPAHNSDIFHQMPLLLEERHRLGVRDHEKLVAYAGNVTPANRKEVASLYLAVVILRRQGHPVRLVRAGTDYTPLFNQPSAEIAAGLLPLGTLERHEEIPIVLGMADFFVQPGRADPFNDFRFPSKLPEFFSIGRPVLLPLTNLGRFVQDGVDAIVLREGHAMEIAERLVELMRDPAKVERLSAAALAFCREHFDWRKAAASIVEFYGKVCTPAPIKTGETTGDFAGIEFAEGKLTARVWCHLRGGEIIRSFRVTVKSFPQAADAHEAAPPAVEFTQIIPNLQEPAERAVFLLEVALPAGMAADPRDLLVIVQPLFDNASGTEFWRMFQPSRPLPSEHLMQAIGGDFVGVAFKFLSYFVQKAGLLPAHRVLDVGCGSGRIAYALAYYLSAKGSYVGFDILPELLEWPQAEIAGRRDNFRFAHVPVANRHYRPAGAVAAAEFSFPCADEEFDFVFLTSVFTHMPAPELRRYLSEIHRVLRSGGRCLATVFLLNPESDALVGAGRASLQLLHPCGEGRVEKLEDPDFAVGYPQELFQRWCIAAGFLILEICPGSWCGRDAFVTYQDFVVLRKS